MDADNDAQIERYHAGYQARLDGKPMPEDMDMREGWRDCAHAQQVRPVMPARPEGYYHTAPEPIEEPPYDDFPNIEAHERWKERGQ